MGEENLDAMEGVLDQIEAAPDCRDIRENVANWRRWLGIARDLAGQGFESGDMTLSKQDAEFYEWIPTNIQNTTGGNEDLMNRLRSLVSSIQTMIVNLLVLFNRIALAAAANDEDEEPA
jgi:hypothetical protein